MLKGLRALRGATRARLAASALALAAGVSVLAPAGDAMASPMRPTGAAAVYKWGQMEWRDEYEVGILSTYSWTAFDHIEDRYGMLVLKGRADGGTTGAQLADRAYRYGRWETRVHLRDSVDRTMPFRMLVELVPTNPAYACGANNIVLADYTMGERRVHFAIRNNGRQYTYSVRPYLGPQDWNTYAVEVARDHISWFVDDHVVMTERRPGALSGLQYTLQYRWTGPQTALRTPWMQMDWSRFYTMQRPNQLSINAPSARVSTMLTARSC